MSLTTPTVADINAQIISQLGASLSTVIPLLPKAFLRVLSKTLAAVYILLWKYGGFIFLQTFVRTATIKEVTINGKLVSPLKEWGLLVGLPAPTAATQAELTITITVTNQTGSLPAGTQFINADNGVTYLLLGAVLLDAPTKVGTIRAAGDQGGGNGAGEIGNLEVGDIVSFANPIANVFRDTVVASQTAVGADEESTESYRQRIIDRFGRRPQGGALIDYRVWGGEDANIVAIYPYTGVVGSDPNRPNGRVDVFAESTNPPDGIPTGPELDGVFDDIELDDAGLASRRPANAFVNVFAITRTSFTVVVADVSGIDISEQAALTLEIESAVSQFFRGREPFVSGVTLPPRTERITQAELITVASSLISEAGGTFLTATMALTTFPAATITNYTLGKGEKAKADAANVTVGYV
ncbi:MAG: baseplate J/gp47 family protein [Planctomycetota bacterium]